jgi:YfiH family protein
MPFQQSNSVRFYQFDLFQSQPLVQGIFTRQGGVSPHPWSSLNVGGTVGDNPNRVQENRARVFQSTGRSPESLHDVWQVHSAEVVLAREPRQEASLQQADILISDVPGVTLFMRFADCVPIFLYDPRNHAIAMVHAGWLGTVLKAAETAVRAMVREFGSVPAHLLAAIGPSIGPDHYEVGEDVYAQYSSSFGAQAEPFFILKDGRRYLDLWSANRYLLETLGVGEIETAGICTFCHNGDWFSHRAEKGRTGRFAALLSLEAV